MLHSITLLTLWGGVSICRPPSSSSAAVMIFISRSITIFTDTTVTGTPSCSAWFLSSPAAREEEYEKIWKRRYWPCVTQGLCWCGDVVCHVTWRWWTDYRLTQQWPSTDRGRTSRCCWPLLFALTPPTPALVQVLGVKQTVTCVGVKRWHSRRHSQQ